MRTTVKLCFTALTAAFLLASAVATTSARSLSTSNQNIRATWSSLEFVAPGLATIRCQVTLEGSFHRSTIQKSPGTLIGAITRAKVKRPCSGGEGWAANGLDVAPLGRLNNTLPWHVTYEAFAGRLPAIEAVILLLSRIRFKIQAGSPPFFGCLGLYGNERDNITGRATREAGGAITDITAVTGRNSASLVSALSGICPERGTFVGRTTSVTLLGQTARITVTLI
jgi:hypothetical protein